MPVSRKQKVCEEGKDNSDKANDLHRLHLEKLLGACKPGTRHKQRRHRPEDVHISAKVDVHQLYGHPATRKKLSGGQDRQRSQDVKYIARLQVPAQYTNDRSLTDHPPCPVEMARGPARGLQRCFVAQQPGREICPRIGAAHNPPRLSAETVRPIQPFQHHQQEGAPSGHAAILKTACNGVVKLRRRPPPPPPEASRHSIDIYLCRGKACLLSDFKALKPLKQDVLQQAKMGVQLGAGAFAAVSTINMMLPEGSAVVALKHVKAPKIAKDMLTHANCLTAMSCEAALLDELAQDHHPNIVTGLGCLSQYLPDPADMNGPLPDAISVWNHGPYRPTTTAIAMEIVAGGSLSSCIGLMLSLHNVAKRDPMGALMKWLDIAVGTAMAIMHVHSKGIWHCDVKPENILCSSQPPLRHTLENNASYIRTWDITPKLADFGLSWKRQHGNGVVDEHGVSGPPARGTSSFAAPEVCRRLHNISTEVLTQQIDIWSLGITLFELWQGFSPWNRLVMPRGDSAAFERSVTWTVAQLQGEPQPGANACWDALETKQEFVTDIIRMCCHPTPKRRPTALQLVRLLEQKQREIDFEIAHEIAYTM